jgi:hypothetical protein
MSLWSFKGMSGYICHRGDKKTGNFGHLLTGKLGAVLSIEALDDRLNGIFVSTSPFQELGYSCMMSRYL